MTLHTESDTSHKDCKQDYQTGKSSPTGAGFNDAACGRVDTALRPSGKDFVWDGLRRCIKTGLCGRDYVSVTTTNHKPHYQDIDCQRAEALWFKIRNSDFESMKPEEVWRSQVVYGDEDALRILTLLKNANLNLEQQIQMEFSWVDLQNLEITS